MMKFDESRLFFFVGMLAGLLTSPCDAAEPLRVHRLRVLDKPDPLNVNARPYFSWQLETDVRNVEQTAYRVLVTNGRDTLWDSGRVPSGQSIHVAYDGRPLTAASHYQWRVGVWTNLGDRPLWSGMASFQTGLFSGADWHGAAWIALEELDADKVDALPESTKKDTWFGNNRLPLFRKPFVVDGEIVRANLFISGLGHFEAFINGAPVSDHFLDAGWAKYDKEALYVAFDVTPQLRQGENAIGVMLGNGFYFIPPVKGRFRKHKVAYGYPKMMCNLILEYADGRRVSVVSDSTWKTAAGPITFSSLYGGEDYDARLAEAGWNQPGFDDSHWQPVLGVSGPPALNPQLAEPLKVFDRFKPRTVRQAGDGYWVYDLGQNASGIIELAVRGKAGDTVRVYPGELVDADGRVTQKATGGPYYFEYVLDGNGTEVWRPRFTYYGFRYLEVRGGVPDGQGNPADRPTVVRLISLHTRNAAPEVGHFSCSDTLFNRVHALIDWAIRSNMASVLTDCPHREKLGWLEQVHLMGTAIQYRYDFSNLVRKTVTDMMHSQLDNGLVPEIAPEYVNFTWGGDMFRDSPEWGSSSVIVPWYLYRWYGDEAVLHRAYPMMKRYLAYLQGRADGHILTHGLGDWYDLGPHSPGVSQLTPAGVTATAIYYYDLTIIRKVALMLGDTAAARGYALQADSVKVAFNKRFFDAGAHQYATGSQTAQAMALYMDLVPRQHRAAVIDQLVSDIRRNNYRFTAGDIGHRYLLRVLEDEGYADVIYAMNNRDDVPGYGYQLAKGATALTESWAALPNVSNNHLMLGHLMEWLYSGLAGIRQAEGSVAYKHLVIHPQPVGDMQHAEAAFMSPYGEVRSAWHRQPGYFRLEVVVPPNSTGLISIPGPETGVLTEEGQALQAAGLDYRGYADGRHLVSVGSGTYLFELKNDKP